MKTDLNEGCLRDLLKVMIKKIYNSWMVKFVNEAVSDLSGVHKTRTRKER